MKKTRPISLFFSFVDFHNEETDLHPFRNVKFVILSLASTYLSFHDVACSSFFVRRVFLADSLSRLFALRRDFLFVKKAELLSLWRWYISTNIMFWTLYIVLSLSENTILFILQNIAFRRLDSVSVFRQNLLGWTQSIELVPISGSIGSNRMGFAWRRRQNPIFKTLCFVI
jgi:hypothetical protein